MHFIETAGQSTDRTMHVMHKERNHKAEGFNCYTEVLLFKPLCRFTAQGPIEPSLEDEWF